MSALYSAFISRAFVAGALLLAPDWTLRWTAIEGCPARAEVEAALRDAWAPFDTATDDETASARERFEINGRVVRTSSAEEFQLEIEFAGSMSGTRTLRGRDCSALTDAAVLIIAIAMSREAQGGGDVALEASVATAAERRPDAATTRALEGAPGSDSAAELHEPRAVNPEPRAAEPTPAIDPPESGPGAEAKRSAPRSSAAGFLRAGGGVRAGHLPAVAVDLAVEGGVTWRLWRMGLAFSGSPPREARAPSNPSVGAQVSLWSFSPSFCGLPGVGDFSFPLCVAVDVGAMRASGTGELVRSDSASQVWLAGRPRVGFLWSRGAFGLWLDLSASVAFTRPAFRTEQTALIFRAGSVGARVLAGVEFRLPRPR